MMSKFDFERAKLLMEIIVEAGKHGPVYQRIASEAGAELRKMVEEMDGVKQPQIITPPAGPANAQKNEDPRNKPDMRRV